MIDCNVLHSENAPSFIEMIPSGRIISIKEGAFSGCKTLQSIILPASLKIIEERAFYDCINLTYVALKSKDTEIHKYAFPFNKKFGK